MVLHVCWLEWQLPDRKADIAHEAHIVHREIQRDCPPFELVADVGRADFLVAD